MESGFPMLNCLLQQTLRSLCTFSDSSTNSSKWVYAVFWRILPRNYPPPKWDHVGGTLDRGQGNKRNWILVWEDGFCDFQECGDMKGRFGADIFFKMSHEVYNYGEGLVGKVAADNSHKWVFGDSLNENDPNFISYCNVSIDPQPRAWEIQFNSGIQTIAIVSIGEGLIQLGSFNKVAEDLNLVISVQRKFNYLQSIPCIYAIQRPCLPVQHPYNYKPNNILIEMEYENENKNRQMIGSKRQTCEELANHRSPIKSINLGKNSPKNGIAAAQSFLSNIPTLLPSMPWQQQLKNTSHNIKDDECAGFTAIQMIKVEPSQEENQNPLSYRLQFEDH